MNRFVKLALVLIIATLFGCAHKAIVIDSDQYQHLLIDSAFVKPINLPEAQNVFVLSKQQQAWLHSHINRESKKSITMQLIDNVLKKDYGAFDYDNSYTRTASETLANKQGNCLSLVIMTAAMAKYLDIPFQIQDIQSAPLWDRHGGLFLLNGHVNIKLMKVKGDQFLTKDYVTLDFLPQGTRRTMRKKAINNNLLGAMYFNNLAADAMVLGDWHRAYWLLSQSIDNAPSYSEAWNSLAVVYRHNNQERLAEETYHHAMLLAPSNMNVISNLALLLQSQNRLEEWAVYAKMIALSQFKNPYRYFDQARNESEKLNHIKAIRLYKKAIRIAPYNDQFYFAVYQSYLKINKPDKARHYLKLAYKQSTTEKDRRRYNMKLNLFVKR